MSGKKIVDFPTYNVSNGFAHTIVKYQLDDEMPDCKNCIEKCPQAEMAHEIAKGRMYATNEFVKLVKKIESGQLVEVVRCKDCKLWNVHPINGRLTLGKCLKFSRIMDDTSFCSYGERRTDG